ncbi:unnamed protein product [Prunus armeniaca]|uniref:ABC1 atypical kinase-like domain-containing protein n=1 Tax=Prunus armeniaca TaxID=36596 RepID=A0A6J5V8Z8_PRUAR|nr:unnamed protein product [Prunus armeniaca]
MIAWKRLSDRWKDVSFPKPLYPLVHPAVLVETYEQGENVDNSIHADMHPGNIPVQLAQSKSSRKRLFKSKSHVIFLDLGMTAELSKSDRVNLAEIFKAVALFRDGRTFAECTLRLSKQHKCPDPKAFIEVKSWGNLNLLLGMIGMRLYDLIFQ